MTFSPKHSKITSEAIRAELRLLKEDEIRIEALRSAIDEGVQSGIAAGFNPESHLAEIKTYRKNYKIASRQTRPSTATHA